jgi:hypothetical protein
MAGYLDTLQAVLLAVQMEPSSVAVTVVGLEILVAARTVVEMVSVAAAYWVGKEVVEMDFCLVASRVSV